MTRSLKKSLLKAAAYPEPTARVQLIETHVSFIFLTDDFVYKVKKPVDFGFLNFTTLDRRRFYCEEELRLNRRLCPEIYLGVVELRATPEGGAFLGSGALLDYAVKMKRLPEDRMLARLLERGQVEPEQMAQIARVIARFHGSAARGPQIDALGSPDAIRANWEENLRQAAPFAGVTLPGADLDLIRGFAERFLAEHEELLRARVAQGFIRECDGDLHLDNICLTDRVCIFDCIEFNEKFRFIDTAADIAFLLMDLEYAGRADLCPPFLESYRRESSDPVPGALLNFYQANRAFVRGKVISFRLKEGGLPPDEELALRTAASRYFRLARGYVLRERLAPALIVTCGLMGSGKSTLSGELAFLLGLCRLRSDQVRKELAGVPAGEARAEWYDQGIYTPAHTQDTYRALLRGAEEALAAGRGVIVDASFSSKSNRDAFRELARRRAVPFLVVQTRCDEESIRERLEKRRLDPNEVSDGRWELYPRQLARFEAPQPGEALSVDGALPLAEQVDLVLAGLGLLP